MLFYEKDRIGSGWNKTSHFAQITEQEYLTTSRASLILGAEGAGSD